jgi:long-subunit fatty acid transport protein
MRKFLIACLFLSGILSAQVSLAYFSNYNSVLVGDQAAGMGGAYTAMDEDGSALAWYNPAALARLKGSAFSASVGIYKKFDTLYNSDGVDLITAGTRANQGFFRALPSAVGSIVRYEDFLTEWTVALTIVTPAYDNFKGDIVKEADDVSSLSLTDESLWVGGAMGRMISPTESFGFTVYYTARSFSKSVSERQILSPTTAKIFSEEKFYTQNALAILLGYHNQLSENWKLGVSWRLPSLHIAGKGTYTETLLDSGTVVTDVSLRDVDSKSHIPVKYTVGVAYDNLDKWLFSGDLSYFSPMSFRDIEDGSVGEWLEFRPVTNLSLGAEYRYNESLRFRAGVFSNFSAHPNPDPALVRGQGDHVDQAGFSANAALVKKNIQYTFGGYYVGGRGQSVQRIANVYQVVPKSQQIFTMLVGTSYHF